MPKLQIHTVVSMPFDENTYVVWADGADSALVFDPGTEPGAILEFLESRGLAPAAIVLTHGHADHIAGNAALKMVHPTIPILIGSGDVPLLADPRLNLSAHFGFDLVSPPADREVREGDVLDLAGIRLEVFEIPGHSPGHVVYLVRGEQPPVVFGGDVLFRGGVGRTDFPGGSFDELRSGIERNLWTLPDDTVVYPGHGPTTTTGYEKRTNPFVGTS
jgi:hydroxyacylglutathione hydrolase